MISFKIGDIAVCNCGRCDYNILKIYAIIDQEVIADELLGYKRRRGSFDISLLEPANLSKLEKIIYGVYDAE